MKGRRPVMFEMVREPAMERTWMPVSEEHDDAEVHVRTYTL